MSSIIRTALLMGGLTGLMLLIGGALGGRGGMFICLILSVLMNFGAYWYSDKIVLSTYHAREVGPESAPEIYGIVRNLAEKGGLTIPKVYVVDMPLANAFATGRDPAHAAVAVTTGITSVLSYDEIEGVIAHELTHVKNRDTLISAMAATLAGVITFLANMAQWALIFGDRDDNGNGNALGALLTAIMAPIAATIIQLAISRDREYDADAGGARLTGRPMALARALSKLERAAGSTRAKATPSTAHMFIVNPLKGASLANLFSTHPSTQDRIKRLTTMEEGKLL
jgi:heat shock protein HtpX